MCWPVLRPQIGGVLSPVEALVPWPNTNQAQSGGIRSDLSLDPPWIRPPCSYRHQSSRWLKESHIRSERGRWWLFTSGVRQLHRVEVQSNLTDIIPTFLQSPLAGPSSGVGSRVAGVPEVNCSDVVLLRPYLCHKDTAKGKKCPHDGGLGALICLFIA